MQKARVRWFLSIDSNSLPANISKTGQRTFRSIKLDGEEIEFSSGFTDLHTANYAKILEDSPGFGLEDARTSIETVFAIRNTNPIGIKGDYHPFLKK